MKNRFFLRILLGVALAVICSSQVRSQKQDTSICHKLIIDPVLFDELKTKNTVPEGLEKIRGLDLPENRILKISKNDLADCLLFWFSSLDQNNLIDSYEFVWDGKISEGVVCLYTEARSRKVKSHPGYRVFRGMKRYLFNQLLPLPLKEIKIYYYSMEPQFTIKIEG
ncbi:MAG: hypothetical protein K1X82_14755 [Bacteroidia bacterium]|nr:hypothetical protein [Bacteroidia bacterium]